MTHHYRCLGHSRSWRLNVLMERGTTWSVYMVWTRFIVQRRIQRSCSLCHSFIIPARKRANWRQRLTHPLVVREMQESSSP